MQVLQIDTEVLAPQIVETEGGLSEWYRLCDCSLIDIAYRKIGSRYYDIILDDEGLFKMDAKVTALNNKGEPVLIGNLVVCNHDPETGEETGLSDDDINYLLAQLVVLTEKTDKPEPRRWLALRNVEP